ncbi:MAG: hypothetical protein EOP08_02755 [Proteobacteria bacterium]|nr:MAG: hypothetical protein EOP08_02755 [Pseudomonadota bacterium]
MKRNILCLFFVSLSVALVAGCKKEAGGSCSTEAEAACDGKTSALTCTSGKWVKTECRGPKGCAVTGNLVDCDHSLASLDDVCDHEGNFACSVDSTSLLQCKAGKFVLDEACKGTAKCKVSGSEAGCE